ncbi:copper homeostasis CutC domain-containing protein [Boletus coccyginus]|nr:copper homeostasis CutC domain-containing protein [Boletus coccyginus]
MDQWTPRYATSGNLVGTIRQQPSKLIIEVCVDSVESAVAAVRGGADRLELCGNLGYGGGTTPSIGLLRSVKKAVPSVPIMTMVRPRTGDFVYSEEEVNVMLQDISVFKEYGVQGVVFGALTAAGDVDETLVRELVAAAVPLEACFHRAFDMARDLEGAWKTLSKVTGITRILTSGQCRHASSSEALEALTWMFDSAGPLSIRILPGSGINVSTIPVLCKALLSHGLEEIHLSGGKRVDGRSTYRPEEMGMGEWSIWRTDEEAIRQVRDLVDRICAAEAGGTWEW